MKNWRPSEASEIANRSSRVAISESAQKPRMVFGMIAVVLFVVIIGFLGYVGIVAELERDLVGGGEYVWSR